jgi:hypothetical protein
VWSGIWSSGVCAVGGPSPEGHAHQVNTLAGAVWMLPAGVNSTGEPGSYGSVTVISQTGLQRLQDLGVGLNEGCSPCVDALADASCRWHAYPCSDLG